MPVSQTGTSGVFNSDPVIRMNSNEQAWENACLSSAANLDPSRVEKIVSNFGATSIQAAISVDLPNIYAELQFDMPDSDQIIEEKIHMESIKGISKIVRKEEILDDEFFNFCLAGAIFIPLFVLVFQALDWLKYGIWPEYSLVTISGYNPLPITEMRGLNIIFEYVGNMWIGFIIFITLFLLGVIGGKFGIIQDNM